MSKVIKRPTKKTEVTKASEVAESVKSETVSKTKIKLSKSKAKPTEGSSEQVLNVKSKTTATNIDAIVCAMIDHFGLNEKNVRSLLVDFLPNNSKFKKHKKKDPNAPKKALSAYMFFAKNNREAVKTDDPSLVFVEITKELGRRWRLIEKGSAEEMIYIKLAEEDKVRFRLAKDAYDAKKLAETPVPTETETETPVVVAPKKKRTKKEKVAPVSE